MHVISALGRLRQVVSEFKASLGYITSKTLSQNTKGWRCSSGVEGLNSMHRALGSISSTKNRKRKTSSQIVKIKVYYHYLS
jgi:hypothetical protein